jgi:hypothetical protein
VRPARAERLQPTVICSCVEEGSEGKSALARHQAKGLAEHGCLFGAGVRDTHIIDPFIGCTLAA